MNEPKEPTKIDPSFWLSLFFVVVIATGVITAAKWRWDTRLFPWAIGVPALLLALWQLVIDFKGPKPQPEATKKPVAGPVDIPVDSTIPADVRMQRTLSAMAWIAGFVLGIWLLGFLIAIPLFVFFYLIYEAQAGKAWAFVLAACSDLFIWIVFELLMHLAWPEAALVTLLK